MREARWNLSGPNGFSQSLIFSSAFLINVLTSFQSHQNAQSFFPVLICFKKLVVERKKRKFLKSDDRCNTIRGNLSNSHVPEA